MYDSKTQQVKDFMIKWIQDLDAEIDMQQWEIHCKKSIIKFTLSIIVRENWYRMIYQYITPVLTC